MVCRRDTDPAAGFAPAFNRVALPVIAAIALCSPPGPPPRAAHLPGACPAKTITDPATLGILATLVVVLRLSVTIFGNTTPKAHNTIPLPVTPVVPAFDALAWAIPDAAAAPGSYGWGLPSGWRPAPSAVSSPDASTRS